MDNRCFFLGPSAVTGRWGPEDFRCLLLGIGELGFRGLAFGSRVLGSLNPKLSTVSGFKTFECWVCLWPCGVSGFEVLGLKILAA